MNNLVLQFLLWHIIQYCTIFPPLHVFSHMTFMAHVIGSKALQNWASVNKISSRATVNVV